MSAPKQDLSVHKQKKLEKERLSGVIRDWADKNKKVFWKYEVASFYKTYKMSVANLPEPSIDDIKIPSSRQLLSVQLKTQLCSAIARLCPDSAVLGSSYVNVQIDYVNDAVVAEVI